MAKNTLVSIIIVDYKKNNPLLKECLDAVEKQSYQNFEIILVTDYPVSLSYPKLIKKSFGHYVGPAQKRDWASEKAKGEILAFIDDDAYPEKNWLKNMVRDFSKNSIAAVGGPGVTPPSASWREVASGWMSASPMGAGLYTYRFLPWKKQYVDDFPSMNLAVRRSDFISIGGFDSQFWPGEDTKLCLDLTHGLKKKILYDPKVLVFHHRRPLWIPHLRQNGNFGLHRGFFARILPETSFRLVYFGPPLMVVGLIYLIISTPMILSNHPILFLINLFGWSIYSLYFLAIAVNGVLVAQKSKSVMQGLLCIPVVFITHFWYGVRFIQGFLFTKSLSR